MHQLLAEKSSFKILEAQAGDPQAKYDGAHNSDQNVNRPRTKMPCAHIKQCSDSKVLTLQR
jgi:hypothetical protein